MPTDASAGMGIIKIPVVVHILYKEAGHNVSDAQIQSQIAALNANFRKLSADTTNIPQRFKALAADIQIEFYLATSDSRGHATNGIVRKQTNITLWMTNDRIKSSAQGGDDAWDAHSYLNIWVGNMASTLGYSSVPGSDPAKDGIVINVSSFGAMHGAGGSGLGRTAVHEVGHWLGLKHIWGDVACGDDGINDTPSQSWYTSGCPNGFRSSCNNGAVGDMYMNFMDYTNDACKNMFTLGQKTKMRSHFMNGGARASLLQSKGLDKPSSTEEAPSTKGQNIAVFPNPATADITLSLAEELMGKTITLLGSNGLPLRSIQVNTAKQKINLATLQPGIYFIKGEGFYQKFIKL